MTFIFEKLTVATVTLAVVYLVLSGYAMRQLLWLQEHTFMGLNTRKLFVMTCLLTSFLRFLSFSSMAFLDFQQIEFKLSSTSKTVDDDDPANNSEFFEKALLVLFDFPDFCCVSAYVLLIVVWAEAFLKSRRHWLSAFRFQRVWMLGYLVFNILVYGAQVTLYSFLFLPKIDQNVLTTLIYLTLTVFNLCLPCIWIITMVYLSIRFAGFPLATHEAKSRLDALSKLTCIWTLCRLAWGCVALTSVVQGWLIGFKEESIVFYTLILILIFIISEVIPLLVSLQLHTLQHFAGSGVERALPTPRGSITSRSNSRCGYRDIGGSASNSRSNSIVNNKDSDDFRPSDGRRSTLSPLADGLIDYTDFGSEQGPTHETIMFSGEPYSIEEYQRRTNSVNAALNFSRFYKSNSSLFPSISSIFSPVNSTTDTDSRTEERKPTQTYQCRNVLSSDDEDSSSYVTADFRSTNSSNNHKAI